MTLERVIFLISRSWQAVNAVLSVFSAAFGSFSCQKRSPFLRRPNCSPIIQPKVGPTRPPSSDGGSAKPVYKLKVVMVYNRNIITKIIITLLTCRIVLAKDNPSLVEENYPKRNNKT